MSKKIVGERMTSNIKQYGSNHVTYETKNTKGRLQEGQYQKGLNHYPSSSYLLKPDDNKYGYNQVHRNPSESKIRTRQEHYRGNLVKRRNDNKVTNLKSDLQNLKMEVSKILNKGPTNRPQVYRSSFPSQAQVSQHGQTRVVLGDYGKDISDSVSVTSEKIIDEPLRRLQRDFQSSNYDHSHYLQLENNLLKTQLRNLKNKYNISKQEWRQKSTALQTKNQYLQLSLKNSQRNLRQCQKQLQIQVQGIKIQLLQRRQQDQRRANSPLQHQQPPNQLLQQKMHKLYQQLSSKTKKINLLTLQLNQFQTSSKKYQQKLKELTENSQQNQTNLEFITNQNQRNKHNLEKQLTKKKQLQRSNQNLRNKINNLTTTINTINQKQKMYMSNNNKQQIQSYKQQIVKLTDKNSELTNNLRKTKQTNQFHQQQVNKLKQQIQEYTVKIQQLSSTLIEQKQKSGQRQRQYRILIEDTQTNHDRQITMLKQQYQNLRQNIRDTQIQKDDVQSKAEIDIKDKDRQISKWKAQYKLLKLKYDQVIARDYNVKVQMQENYRKYKISDQKNKQLQYNKKILEETLGQNLTKIQLLQHLSIIQKTQYQQQSKQNNRILVSNQRIIQQLQQQLKQSIDNYTRKSQQCTQFQSMIKKQQKQLLNTQNMTTNRNILEDIQRRIQVQDDKLNKYVKDIKKKQVTINKLKRQIRQLMEDQDQNVQKLRKKQVSQSIQNILKESENTNKLLKEKSGKQLEAEKQAKNKILDENLMFRNKLDDVQREFMKLQQDTKRITLLYNQKNQELTYFKEVTQQGVKQLQDKMGDLQQFKNLTIKNLHSEIALKHQEILSLRAQNRRMYSAKGDTAAVSFDQALKNQIDSANKLREELERKNEQIYRLRDSISSLKAQFDNLKSESDIGRLKFISEKKNIHLGHDVQMQQHRIQYSTEQKKVSTLQSKIKMLVDQNKKKDAFIQNYIMSKKLPTNEKQMVANFLKEYEIHVNAKNISQRLEAQSEQLLRLAKHNSNLMREIGQLKQKMTLYEAISISMDNDQMTEQFSNSPVKKVNKMNSLSSSIR